jgi:hypothetical protein
MGGLLGGEIHKPKAYFQGGWGKYRKINNFRIIGKGNFMMLCPINSAK